MARQIGNSGARALVVSQPGPGIAATDIDVMPGAANMSSWQAVKVPGVY